MPRKQTLIDLIIIVLLLLLGPAVPAAAQEPDSGSGGQEEFYNEAYYAVDELNAGLPALANPPELRTPQAAVEHFIMAGRNVDFAAAARALNLNLIPRPEQADLAPELADKLYYILDHSTLIDWATIPDRPDGQVSVTSGDNPLAGEPRRSISLGSLDLDGRDIEIILQRVKPGDATPLWLFSASTVENIEPLYERYGPTAWDRMMPSWAKVRPWGIAPLWEWLALLFIVGLGILFGWLVRGLTRWLVQRLEKLWSTEVAAAVATPAGLIAGSSFVYIAWELTLTLTEPIFTTLDFLCILLIIIAFTWLISRLLQAFTTFLSRSYVGDLAAEDTVEHRQLLTYLSVARWGLTFVVVLIGISVALFQFDLFKQIGVSVLTSAGVLSVILGVAAQKVLSNIIGGFQIALTQPVRIGDNVNFNGEWSYIENIAYTYLTLRTWDQRRIIVPFNYFLDHPIENWEKNNASMIIPVVLYLDFSTDIQKVREKYEALVRDSSDWDDETEPRFQVTDVTEQAIQVRAVVGANDPSTAWKLHCELREALVTYVQQLENGRFLPKERTLVEVKESGPLIVSQENNHRDKDN